MEPIKWTLGDIVRKIRLTRGLKQQPLADQAGIDVTALIRLERESDKSERATIDRVARALKIPLSVLHAHVEHASLFAELSETEQKHVVDLERRLVAKRAEGHAPTAAPAPDPVKAAPESRGPVRKLQRR